MTEELRYERVIDAPPDVVFDLFTTPGGQQAFYGKDDPGWIVESACDVRVGGVWDVKFGPSPDRLYRHRHRFEIIDHPRRIVLATTEFRLDGSRIEFTTTFVFAALAGRTLMTMIQTGLPAQASRHEHSLGLKTGFDRFVRLVSSWGPA